MSISTLILDTQIAFEEAMILGFTTKIEALQKSRATYSASLTNLFNQKAKLHLEDYRETNGEDAVDWAFLLDFFPDTTAKSEARDKAFKAIGLKFSTGGYFWRDTKQAVVKIGLYNKSNPESNRQQMDAVTALLPFIKADETGAKRVEVFEHTFAEGGKWVLDFMPDTRIKLTCNDRSGASSYATIEEAFTYVTANLWYQE